MRPNPRTTPRKEPQQSRSHETVEAILAAAARILVRDGYAATSTNRIAELAGISIGSLYEYFPNKDAILAMLRRRHHERMHRVISNAFADVSELPLEVGVRTLVRRMVEAHAVEPELQAALVLQLPDQISRPFQRVDKDFLEHTRAFLEAHHSEVRSRDKEVAAVFVVHTIRSLTHAGWVAFPERLKDGRVATELTDLLLRYLARG